MESALTSNKEKEKDFENIRILIRFSSLSNNFSCSFPKLWTVKRLKNFIGFCFKNEYSNNFNIIYCGKILQNDEQILSNIFKKEEILNMIFISYKQNEKKESKIEKNLKDPTKFDVVKINNLLIKYINNRDKQQVTN
jgi:hypothetical protein